ncbi:hypothetical protein [Phaffia rhodozyma]|uniref:Uncharacterized protein n=1 Tax=Phaffia rhodozyma TaxID=264483 RepID=A0A0F7SN18_PHARH|nr:hypothetical protein [Phaffia rhodozyma]
MTYTHMISAVNVSLGLPLYLENTRVRMPMRTASPQHSVQFFHPVGSPLSSRSCLPLLSFSFLSPHSRSPKADRLVRPFGIHTPITETSPTYTVDRSWRASVAAFVLNFLHTYLISFTGRILW